MKKSIIRLVLLSTVLFTHCEMRDIGKIVEDSFNVLKEKFNSNITQFQYRFMSMNAMHPEKIQISLFDLNKFKVLKKLKQAHQFPKKQNNFPVSLVNLFTSLQ